MPLRNILSIRIHPELKKRLFEKAEQKNVYVSDELRKQLYQLFELHDIGFKKVRAKPKKIRT
jgi:hypothetical protein